MRQEPFLNPLIVRNRPVYAEIVGKLKKGVRLLEMRCFIGHGLRKLVSIAFSFLFQPAFRRFSPLRASLRWHAIRESPVVTIASHWDLGYSMFNGPERFHSNFIEKR